MKKIICCLLLSLTVAVSSYAANKAINSSFIKNISSIAYDFKSTEENSNTTNNTGTLILVNRDNSLSKDYSPKGLVELKIPFKVGLKPEEKKMVRVAAEHLEKMVAAANEDGIELYCASAYRSNDYQQELYNDRVASSGVDAANKYVAMPGHSEHETGLAIDLTNSTGAKGIHLTDFGTTAEGKWVRANSYKYGFILRYPYGKESQTGYNYEPWHIRYVGKKVAAYITKNDITFDEYIEQRYASR